MEKGCTGYRYWFIRISSAIKCFSCSFFICHSPCRHETRLCSVIWTKIFVHQSSIVLDYLSSYGTLYARRVLRIRINFPDPSMGFYRMVTTVTREFCFLSTVTKGVPIYSGFKILFWLFLQVTIRWVIGAFLQAPWRVQPVPLQWSHPTCQSSCQIHQR